MGAYILLRTVVRGSVAVVHGDESAVIISYSTRVQTATCPPEFPSEMTCLWFRFMVVF